MMMMAEGTLSFSVAEVVEDVLQQHGTRLRDLDLASRKAEEAASRRNEAAGWLRKMVGVVAAKDLPAEPSEEEFRLGLRSGIILCNVLNKVHPGAVPKVVESPCDSALIPDGAALSAFQYFENVRNFLVAVQELGIPTFEASDLEQGGKSARVVNCVLAVKSYSEWKQAGGNGVWKFGGNVKPMVSAKSFVRKNSEPFTNSLSRNSSMGEKSLNVLSSEIDSNKMPTNGSLSMLVRAVLLDKKPEEVPMLVESVLSKVVEEFEHRIASQLELMKTSPKDMAVSRGNKALLKFTSADKKTEDKNEKLIKKEEFAHKTSISDEKSKGQLMKQQMIFDQQQRDIQELKHTLHTTKAGMNFMQMKFHEEFHNLGIHIHGLAHAASGYHRVLEENRKLYNQVQDLKGSIRVYCRVRPFLSGQSNHFSAVDHIEEGIITMNTPSRHGKGQRSFSFNKVFGPSASQEIRNSSHRGHSVPDANVVPVSSTFDVIDLMNLGQKNRAVGATALNDRSSRSHSCLTVHVQGRDLTSGVILRGCMHLVDLAGSERVDKSEVTGDRLKEAQHINKSLSALGDVIASLAQKNPHVPYRNSKLTQLLQDSLGGQAKTLMFVHISPEPDAIGESISTLKFAERVATVELGAAKVNKDGTDVKELKEQIASLKAALARKEGEPEHIQTSISGSSEKYRTKASEISPFQSKQKDAGLFGDHNSCRQPMGDVGNIELRSNSASRQKTQSFDLDELLANSPPWPPVNGHGQNYREDDREMGSGEWVDKVMVNKHDVSRVENPLGSWAADNGDLSDVFYQKYLPDSSKIYSDQSYNMFMGSNQFNVTSTDEMDDLDAATSDSSEPDLLWQFNHSKLTSMTNGISAKTRKPNSKPAKSPELSKNTNASLGPSPSRKLANGVGNVQRNGRQPAPTDMKRRAGNRK
ncbi:kinesin-like protein kin-14i [Quercus suber]|uniref:Kinesin-like protein kin-14i n=1 Tax=Quercus suber TaxID=58331 RepID=A0AAW0L672_QUESU